MALFPRSQGQAPPRRQEAEDLSIGLPALLVAAERVASTVAQGAHGRRRVGQGETFWQFRPYFPGDTANRIDWRQTARREGARSANTYVRDQEWEAAQSVFLWCDRSPSMNWRSSSALPTKADRAALLLMALAMLLVRGGERVGLLGSPERPSPGQLGLDRLIRQLDSGERDSLPRTQALPRRAQIVLFGDFLAPLDETRALLAAYLGSECCGQLVQIFDPAEEDLPYSGRIRFEGLEREPAALISRTEDVRESYQFRVASHRAGLRQIAAAAGWGFIGHRTDHPPATALLALWTALSGQS